MDYKCASVNVISSETWSLISLVSVRRGARGPSMPSVHDEERNREEGGNVEGGEDGHSPHESAVNIGMEMMRALRTPARTHAEAPTYVVRDTINSLSIIAPLFSASEISSSGPSQAPRRSRRLQRGPTAGLLSAAGGSSRSASGVGSRSGATTAAGPWTSLMSSTSLSTSLTDIVGVPLHGVTATA